MRKSIFLAVLGVVSACVSAVTLAENTTVIDNLPHRPVDPERARRGYVFLQQLPLGPALPGLKLPDLEQLFTAWDGEDQAKAANASPEERRKLAYARYGFVEAPYENHGLPMGLVYNPNTHGVHINCLLCHSGSIRGQIIPGLPNQRMDLATFAEDIFVLNAKGKNVSRPVATRIFVSDHKSRTRGGSNVWIEESELLSGRTPELNPTGQSDSGPWQSFDTTPSPYWNIKKKTRFYHTGFISVGPRPPMLAVLYDKTLTGDQFKALLPDFEDVAQWLDAVEVPKYPGPVNSQLAAQGKVVFEQTCAECHGTYGDHPTFPNANISIGTVKTDGADLNGKGDFTGLYYKSWFNKFGLEENAIAGNFIKRDQLQSSRLFDGVDSRKDLDPKGYLAPPLDGIWASAPYLHNGSVPTLFHMLHPDQRPAAWKVTDYDGYDDRRVGLLVEEFTAVPEIQLTASDRRRYFDTSVYGLSATGHPFANGLTEEERNAVLEYLKTL